MADIKKLFRRNRFSLEILGIVALAEFAVMVVLGLLEPRFSRLQTSLLDAVSLIFVCAPLIFWRSRAVHGLELQNLSNITELKLAKISLQASLRDSEALRHTVETHAIVSVADDAGRIIDANPAFCAISGYSREQLIGQDHRLLNSGTHTPEFWASMWDDISHGKPWRGEICNRDNLGQLYWVDSMIAPFLGADGLVEKYISIRVDITARKIAQDKLTHQILLLTEVMDAAPYGLAVFDDQQVLRLHNMQFVTLLDLSVDMLAQKPFYFSALVRYLYTRGDYGFALSFDEVLAGLQDAMATRKHLTLERRQFDGRHIELRIYPISAGWTVLNYRDNTERKNQQIHLNEAQERVRLATESAGIGIWSMNTTSGEQAWDEQQYRLFGIDSKAQSDSKIYALWARHLHPEDAEEARAAFQHTINNGVPFDQVFRIIRPDGAVRHIKALGSPRFDAEGKVDYVVGTNMDVTDATLLAESMREARARADEANRVKSQFLANMSHEIRTPMNAVQGTLKLLELTVTDTQQQEYVAQASEASRQMLRLVDSVLDFSRLESGRMTLARASFHVDEWLDELMIMLSASVGNKDINMLIDVTRPLPSYLVGDALRLRQVLLNLAGNAIKFTHSGEVVCQIAMEQQSVANCRLAFCVRDTGIGIAPEFLATIFNEFVQVQSSTTRAYGGAGLGLPIAQRLVKMMGGTIEVQSEPGVGSSFAFTLDFATPDPLPAAPEQGVLAAIPNAAALVVDAYPTALRLTTAMTEVLHAPDQTTNNGDEVQQKRLLDLHSQHQAPRTDREPLLSTMRIPRLTGLLVLVVEDNPINQRVMQQHLVAEGARVELAENGQRGVDAIRASLAQQAFDVVLMDIQMPVMDGYQATRAVRNELGLQQLPIIAVSANVLPTDREQCLAAGMNEHIGKPYELDELVAVIRRLTGLTTDASAPVRPYAPPATELRPQRAMRALHAYWVRGNPQDALPDAASLLQHGVVLQLLDTVAALETLIVSGATQGALIVLDLATATSEPMRTLCGQVNGADMNTMAMVVQADAVTEVDMQTCLSAGVVDMVPLAYARDYLGVIARKHINAKGELRVDVNNKVVAIDTQGAMERMESDLAFFGSLLRAFFDELPLRRQLLHDHWRLDPGQVMHRSHALKGLALTLGLKSLATVASQAELFAQNPDANGAASAALLLQLEGEIQSARFQILRWLTQYLQSAMVVP